MREVILYNEAFDSIIFSGAEIYKKETLGWLCGEIISDIYHVKEAFYFQTADNKYVV